MQSRAVREGSVGLMLIAGLGVFGAIFLWLRGMTPNPAMSINPTEPSLTARDCIVIYYS